MCARWGTRSLGGWLEFVLTVHVELADMLGFEYVQCCTSLLSLIFELHIETVETLFLGVKTFTVAQELSLTEFVFNQVGGGERIPTAVRFP